MRHVAHVWSNTHAHNLTYITPFPHTRAHGQVDAEAKDKAFAAKPRKRRMMEIEMSFGILAGISKKIPEDDIEVCV